MGAFVLTVLFVRWDGLRLGDVGAMPARLTLPRFAFGSLLFGMASIATRGLAVPIGIHAAWNVADWMRGNRSAPGLWHPEVAKGFETSVSTAGIVAYVVLMALATLGFWLWHRMKRRSADGLGGSR